MMDQRLPSRQGLRALLIALDVLGFVLAYTVTYTLRLQTFAPEQVLSGAVFSFAVIDVICFYLLDLYQFDARAKTMIKPLHALAAVAIATCVIVVLSYFFGAIEFTGILGRGVLIGAQAIFAFWTAWQRLWLNRWLRKASQRARWLVLGQDEYLKPFLQELTRSRLTGTYVCLTENGSGLDAELGEKGPVTIKREGSWSQLEVLVCEAALSDWAGIIVCAGSQLPEHLVEVLMNARLHGVRVIDLTDFYEENWLKVPVFYVQRSWFALSQGFQLLHNPIGLRLKRVLDLLMAFTLLLLTSPLVLLAALAVKLESPGPAIYRQTRVGQNGRLFTVYKIRSMRNDAEKSGARWATVKDHRVTRIGRFLRLTRIDELPQLCNVIFGDMSFIGPRPERPEFIEELEKAIPFYNLRHLLRPGITGWAQVMYRYGASVEDAVQKLQYELFYIKNYSIWLDFSIALKTVKVVLFGQGQ